MLTKCIKKPDSLDIDSFFSYILRDIWLESKAELCSWWDQIEEF